MTDGKMTEQHAVSAAVAQFQDQIDESFLLAVENGEFKSPSILLRIKVGEKGQVTESSVLSEEYKESELGGVIADMAKNFELPPGMQGKTLRVRLMWSTAFARLGQAALVPVKEEVIDNLYVGGTIQAKYESSIQEMFQKLDELIGVPVYSQAAVEFTIGKGGKVQKARVTNEAFRGTLLDQHVGETLNAWQFPGIKKSLTQTIALQRAASMPQQSGEANMATGEGQATASPNPGQQGMAWWWPFCGGTATEIIPYPTRPFIQDLFNIPNTVNIPGAGGPANEIMAYPTRPWYQNAAMAQQQAAQVPGFGGGVIDPVPIPFRPVGGFQPYAQYAQQYQFPQFGGGATEVIPYPFRPKVQFTVPQQYQFPQFGGGATEIIAYPFRPSVQMQAAQQYQAPQFGGGATEIIPYPVRPAAQTMLGQQYLYPAFGGPANEIMAYPTRPVGQFQYWGGPATEMHPYPFRQVVQQMVPQQMMPGYYY